PGSLVELLPCRQASPPPRLPSAGPAGSPALGPVRGQWDLDRPQRHGPQADPLGPAIALGEVEPVTTQSPSGCPHWPFRPDFGRANGPFRGWRMAPVWEPEPGARGVRPHEQSDKALAYRFDDRATRAAKPPV